MSHNLHHNPPELKRRMSLPAIAGIVFMGAVMVCLPISQFIADSFHPPTTQVDTSAEIPIPDLHIPPPPPVVDDKVEYESLLLLLLLLLLLMMMMIVKLFIY